MNEHVTEITNHLARPGPCYWDWRCLTCDQACADHIGLVRYLIRKVWTSA